MADPACARCPVPPSDRLCVTEGGTGPEESPTRDGESVRTALTRYDDPEIARLAREASVQEGAGYRGRGPDVDRPSPAGPDSWRRRSWPEASAALLEAGAVNVYAVPCLGRKGRPALEVTVLCPPPVRDGVLACMFHRTPTLGIRIQETPRAILERRVLEVETAYGTVRVKIGSMGDEAIRVEPEYEDCRAASESRQADLQRVITAAREAAYRLLAQAHRKD